MTIAFLRDYLSARGVTLTGKRGNWEVTNGSKTRRFKSKQDLLSWVQLGAWLR